MRNQQNRCGLKNTSCFYLLPSLVIVLMMISDCGGSGGGNHRTDDIDTNPPALSNGSPTGDLPADTTETDIFVTSDENATCKYDMSPGIDYDLKSNMFQNTGGTSHSTAVTGLVNGQSFIYYVKCRDSSGNVNENDYLISFSVQNGVDTNPPVLSNGSPTGALPADTTETNIFVTSNENATCKYDMSPGIDYDLMSNMFQNTGGTSHLSSVTGLQNGQTFTYYVKCQDSSGNANENDYPISFSVNSADPTVTINRIYTMNTGNIFHATARSTIELVHRSQDVWFVFHAESRDPCCAFNGFQTSQDGITWSLLKTGLNADSDELSRSYLVEGNQITRLYPANDYIYIGEGTINGDDIDWMGYQSVIQGSYYYYNDLKRDASGRLHFSGRYYDGNVTHIIWMRAQNPYDNSDWESPVVIVSGDSTTPRVDAHVNIQLDGDEVYVVSRTATDNIKPSLMQMNLGGFYGRHFNGFNWEASPTQLGVSNGIAGSDKRLSAAFDPNSDTVHLVYIDDSDKLYHRTLTKPYDSSNWNPPQLVASNVFSCILGVDTTVSPSRVALLYGDQVLADSSDGRNCAGDLYLKWFDGQDWEADSLLISEPGTTYNWYPNMLRDVSGDIGVMYLKGRWNDSSADIMFSLIEY